MFRSLKFRFGLALVTIQIVMLAIIVWNSNNNYRHNYEHRLHDTARNLAAQVASTSSRFLLELDSARLGEYVQQTMTHDELLYVAVYDSDEVRVAGQGPVPSPGSYSEDIDPHRVDDGVLTIIRDVRSNDEFLGRVVLGFSLEMMESSLADALRQSLALAAGLVLLTVVTSYFIGRSLTRDLADVSEAVANYGVGENELSELRASTLEVQSVVKSLSTMASDRERAQYQREETARFYQSLIERSSDIVIVAAPTGSIRFAGPSVTRILGYDPSALVGTMLADLAADARTKDLIAAKLDATVVSDVLELDLANSSGQPRTLEVLWRAQDAGRIDDGYVLNCRDVTERRALEERFRKSEKMEAIGQLTGGVAHDFNNQLAVIMGNLELVEEETSEVAKKQALAQAIKACSRSAELTRNLLSFSRKSHLSPQVIDLNAVVRDASSWIQRTLPATIRVETSLLAGLWPARLDPTALENALLNLVINARDAMAAGGTLTIETSNTRIDRTYLQSRMEDFSEGPYVVLAVSDTGTGIAEVDQEKIFEPFYTTKPVGSGSGLGLPSVHGFVRQSGGAIRVYSELGKGTTIKLFFPSVAGALPAPEPAAATQPIKSTRGARLLVVEDASDVLNLMRRTLEGAGYEVVLARNGDIGYEVFKSSPDFDLLVTDIVMPGEILGTRLAKKVRALRPDLPVVFITGYATEAAMYGNGLRPEDIRACRA